MSHFRKSKSPADISASTPTSPTELIQNLTSLPRGDTRALAASSTAIALSICSAFCDTRDASGDGAAVRGRDPGWQTAYDAVKMAVEITKESSDMLFPLKAVVGAVSVLIKYYDVSPLCSQTERLLILWLFPPPANVGQRGGCEGDRAEGAVAIRRACLSCK
jgi:hypothetical protein